jgi:hypothetical protein
MSVLRISSDTAVWVFAWQRCSQYVPTGRYLDSELALDLSARQGASQQAGKVDEQLHVQRTGQR